MFRMQITMHQKTKDIIIMSYYFIFSTILFLSVLSEEGSATGNVIGENIFMVNHLSNLILIFGCAGVIIIKLLFYTRLKQKDI